MRQTAGMQEELAALATEYWDGVMARSPLTATLIGDHRFDQRIDDIGPDALAEHRQFAVAMAERAHAIEDGELDAGERMTRALLIDACAEKVESIDSEDIQLRSDGFTSMPVVLLRSISRMEAPTPESAEAQLQRFSQLPVLLDQVIDHWRTGAARGWLPATTSVGRTRAMIDAHLSVPVDADPFVNLQVPADWAGTDDWRRRTAELVRDDVRPAYERTATALADLAAAGRGDDEAGLCNIPDGAELYASLVRRATTTELGADEIHRIGMEELTEKLPGEWAEVGHRAIGVSDRDELFARLRSDPAMKYGTAPQILERATDAIRRALEAAPDWFERLPAAGCVVEEVPASLAPGSPPAYYGPPPGDGTRPGVYFANTHEPSRRNRFEAEVFAFHEAVPGHHLERALAAELTDVPMFQRRGGYMAYSEGWGLYSERLADEMGLYSSDVMRLGMLSADAWRSARLVIDTGLHALGWTRAQAIEFMTTHVPIDPAEAAVEVDRYIGMPGQALSYKIGQREMFRLRADAKERLGARFDIKAFHRTVLEHGGVTLGILADLVDAWVSSRLDPALQPSDVPPT